MKDPHLETIIFYEIHKIPIAGRMGVDANELAKSIRERIEAEYTFRLKPDADMSDLKAAE